MEGLEADDLLRELENYSPSQFNLMNPLMDLTSGRKNLMSKCLDLQEEESWPLLAEYFGVALAFAALGALIRGANGNRVKENTKDNNPKLQKVALQTMLKGAMERLQFLAQNAQDMQERLVESTEAREKDRDNWLEEKTGILQRIANAEEEVQELKIMRGEDAKANEKVVRIYANREHGWKIEKKKLCHEIDILRKDLIDQEVSGLCSPKVGSRSGQCDECDLKERRLVDLKNTLEENEFMIMTTMEDARNKEAEFRELTSRLDSANTISRDLNEKLDKELSNSAEREIVIAEVRSKQKETECQLAKVVEELDTTKTHLEVLSLASENHSAMSQQLLNELATLRQESDDKDVIMSTMLERATVEREEKEDLARELAAAQAGRETAEAETGRWKRLAEERTRQNLFVEVPDARSGHRSHRSLGNRSEMEKVADLQRSHAEEVNSIRAKYSRQVEALEKQVGEYRAKAQDSSSTFIPALYSADLQEPLTDPAFKEWFKVVKGRFATQMEEKHWNQIETFERHLRAKDERLSAFRSKLLTLESELAQVNEAAMNECPTEVKTVQNGILLEQFSKDVGCVGCARMAMAHQRSIEKLRMELNNVKNNLKEQDAEHSAIVEKMEESTEAELQHKDVQLAIMEAKLCQVQLQLEEAKLANEMTSSDNCHEKMFLENIIEVHAPQPEEELQCSRHDGAYSEAKPLEPRVETAEKKHLEMRFEESVQLDDSVSDSAKLLTRLKDMCLKEEKPPALVRFHRKLELETSDSLIFETDDCWLTAEQKTGEMSLKFLPAEDFPQSVKVPHLVCEDETVAFGNNTLRSECGREVKSLAVHKRGKKGVNKQPLSPDAGAYHGNAHQKFDDILFTQAPSKGTRPARFDMSDVLEEHKSQRTLFTDIEGMRTSTTNPTFITQESEDREEVDEERQKSRTREDIQVLGLALEVRRIEQKLTEMNKSIGDARALITRPARSIKSPVKQTTNQQTKRYTGLAGKVSQLAKQIGLTRPLRRTTPKSQIEVKKECTAIPSPVTLLQSPNLCLRKNPLFLQESSTSELASLHHRAEKVGENLSAIQARLEKENSPDFYEHYKPCLFPKGKLVDTVRAHLSQVQGALHSKLTQTNSVRRPLLLPAPNQSKCTPTKALTLRKYSPPTKASTPSLKQQSPTKPVLTPSPRRVTPSKTLTPSPRRITSTKLLTPSPRSFTPTKPLTPALSPYGRRAGSPTKPKQVHSKTTMRELVNNDPRSRAIFGRKDTQPSTPDLPPRQWARKTSTHYELDLEHLR